ncbi:hypothetical protein DIKCMJMK_00857 [Shewanella oneidensis]|nr:hypothetical protein [Shewanella oneidensis]
MPVRSFFLVQRLSTVIPVTRSKHIPVCSTVTSMSRMVTSMTVLNLANPYSNLNPFLQACTV